MTLVLWSALLLTGTPAGEPAESTRPTILDFHAEWCGPCRELRPTIDQLKNKGYPVRTVDIDKNPSLRDRYRITAVPTQVIVDPKGRELVRNTGPRSATELVSLYSKAKVQLANRAKDAADDAEGDEAVAARTGDRGDDDADSDPKGSSAPDPWKTGVRIRIESRHSAGFGSGTVVYSTDEEAIILTCAHIFHDDNVRQQHAPAKFPHRIVIDLFDGRLHGTNPPMLHPTDSLTGQAVDYDFTADVGLIRIRPGRKLPVSPVVPPDWQPREGLKMMTVGCSEGHNATPWTTYITNPSITGLVGKGRYQAIECRHAPKQGRSGGGLYIDDGGQYDGYVAGVCDFAEPRGRHGLYAAPRSIHRILDRNRLTVCYNPKADGPQTLMADRGNAGSGAPIKYRSQNAAAGPEARPTKTITLPDPALVDSDLPAESRRRRPAAPGAPAWQSADRLARSDNPNNDVEAVDLKVDPDAVDDELPATAANGEDSPPEPTVTRNPGQRGGWRKANSESVEEARADARRR